MTSLVTYDITGKVNLHHLVKVLPAGFLFFSFFLFLIFIYLAVPGLSCSTQDLRCHVRDL